MSITMTFKGLLCLNNNCTSVKTWKRKRVGITQEDNPLTVSVNKMNEPSCYDAKHGSTAMHTFQRRSWFRSPSIYVTRLHTAHTVVRFER